MLADIKIGPDHLYRLPDGVGPTDFRHVRWYVIEKLRKNVRIKSEDGTQVARVDPAYLIPVDESTEGTDAPPPPEPLPPLDLGQCVRFTRDPAIFVVIGFIGAERYRITRLGGDGNRYWKAPRGALAPVTPKEVAEYLVDDL